jgi:DNA polymerase III epsilon subunit-like protein
MFLFFDTETTGLPRNWEAPISDFENWPRLVQLAYQLFDDEGNFIMEGGYIIKPEGFIIPKEVSELHGITNEEADSKGISLTRVLEDFNFLLYQAHTIVSHNLSFDEKIICCEYLRLNRPNPLADKRRICTMESATNYCAIYSSYGYKYPTLSELYHKLFKIKLKDSHNAKVDVRVTSECFWELVSLDVIKINQSPSLIPFRKGSKWGYCTPDKKLVIDCEFDTTLRFTQGIGRVWKNERYGYVDLKGNFLTDIKYQFGCEFNEGYAGVKENNYWYFIDLKGRVAFDGNKYESIQNFHDGLAGVILNDKLGFIDINGNQVIPPFYDYHVFDDGIQRMIIHEIFEGQASQSHSNLYNFHQGCVRLKKDEKYGFVNSLGKIVTPFNFDAAVDFSDGLAEVGMMGDGQNIISGYIDKNGSQIIPFKYKYEHTMPWGYNRQSQFKEGMALVIPRSLLGDGYRNKEVFINKDGEVLIQSNSHDFCSGFSEGLAVVSKQFGEYIFNKGRERKYGFIDSKGILAIDFRFDWAQQFSDGLAAVKINGNYGFINNLGRIVIDCKYNKDLRRSKFINGLLYIPGEYWKPGLGYINNMGVEYWED